jgi:pyruvate formate lyase activating enzyme
LQAFLKTSFIDYPSKIAAVCFFGGCNFRCTYCHNPDFLTCSDNSKVPDEDVLTVLKARQSVLEGVVITGGEASLQPNLIGFIEQVKNLGYDVKLDTNGSNVDCVKNLLDSGLIDYVALDIKGSYRHYKEMMLGSGLIQEKNYESLLMLLDFLKTGVVDYELRSTLYPVYFSEQDDIDEIKALVAGAKSYYLQPYRSEVTYSSTMTTPLRDDDVLKLQEQFNEVVDHCYVR